jgi:hypothetical protein
MCHHLPERKKSRRSRIAYVHVHIRHKVNALDAKPQMSHTSAVFALAGRAKNLQFAAPADWWHECVSVSSHIHDLTRYKRDI